MVVMICKICGSEYKRPPSRIGASSCCGNVCRQEMLRRLSIDRKGKKHQNYVKRKIVQCQLCGNSIGIKGRSLLSNLHYCSDACRNKHLPTVLLKAGKSHPAWRGGSTKYRGPNWKHQRLLALKRDDYKCQECGDHTKEVHHKRPFVFFNNYKDANELTNLESLCKKCHKKAEVLFWKNYNGKIPISPYRNNHIACKICGEKFVGKENAKPGGVLLRCQKCRERKCGICKTIFLLSHNNDPRKYCCRSCGRKAVLRSKK